MTGNIQPMVDPYKLAEMMERGRRDHDAMVRQRQTGEVEREPWCICDDGFWLRGLDDPACRHDEIGLRQMQIDALRLPDQLLYMIRRCADAAVRGRRDRPAAGIVRIWLDLPERADKP